MALLPTAEDAATAFAEVYFAIDLLYQREGSKGLRTLLTAMADGQTDQRAVESVFKAPFPQFEKAWLAHVKKQPFPKELIPRSQKERKELIGSDDSGKDKKKKAKDVPFGDFKEVEELDARRWAHLGAVMREHSRPKAAAEHFGLAWQQVKDRYESVSNQYALTLLELKRFEEAEGVLRGSLKMHPGSGPSSVHLGRILLRKGDYAKARDAYLDALAVNPFDPEVHLALYRCYDSLGDAAMRERVKKAFLVLAPQVAPEALATLSREFSKADDLSHVDFEAHTKAPGVVDAGVFLMQK
jgi:tetratricopeptide (TPR) repeat protein